MKKIDEEQLKLQEECRRIKDNRLKCDVQYDKGKLVSGVYIYKTFDTTNMCDYTNMGIIVSLKLEGIITGMFIPFEKIKTIKTLEE